MISKIIHEKISFVNRGLYLKGFFKNFHKITNYIAQIKE